MALPADIQHYIPFLVSICDIFSARETRLLLSQGDRRTLQVTIFA